MLVFRISKKSSKTKILYLFVENNDNFEEKPYAKIKYTSEMARTKLKNTDDEANQKCKFREKSQ